MLTTRLLPQMAIFAAMAWGTAASATPREAAHSLFEAITSERSRYAHDLIDYAVPAELLLLPDSVDEMEELSAQMDITAFCALAERDTAFVAISPMEALLRKERLVIFIVCISFCAASTIVP